MVYIHICNTVGQSIASAYVYTTSAVYLPEGI